MGALDRLLRETEFGWDVFLGEDLPGGADWHTLTGMRLLYRTASPVLQISGQDWPGFLSSRTRAFREQLRRQGHRRVLVAAPLVCHLIGRPKRHFDPDSAIATSLLIAVPPVGGVLIVAERAMDGLYWLRRKFD